MTLGGRAFEEKRGFVRMKVDVPLKAQLTGEAIAADAICHELSGGGMRLETLHELAPDTQVDVTLGSEYGHRPTLRAKTRVVRTYAEQNTYFLGLEILEILT